MVRFRKDFAMGDLLAPLNEPDAPDVSIGYSTEVTGRGPLDARISRAVSHALREARERGISRADAAERLSDFLNRTISPAMLDKWASEAADDHRIPLDVFIGLIETLQADGLIGFVPMQFGHVAVAERHADLIRLTLVRERMAELEAQEKALEARVRRGK